MTATNVAHSHFTRIVATSALSSSYNKGFFRNAFCDLVKSADNLMSLPR